MRDADKYPSPVRARGSGHSTTVCGVADGGTVINMKPMSRILDIGTDTVTAEAGAMLIDVAKELEQRGLQFYVNIELGNATIGSLACCATKDASMPGEFGQANSYCVAMKMVTPSGEILEVDESDPGLLQAARSSYGLFGVVYEATFKVQPLQAMQVEHKSFKLDEFLEKLPELFGRGQSIMMYIFPYLDRISVEFRKYTGPADQAAKPASHSALADSQLLLEDVHARLGSGRRSATSRRAGSGTGWSTCSTARPQGLIFPYFAKARHTVPTDQMIRYPEVSGGSRYTFSIWAFREERYRRDVARVLPSSPRSYYRRTGFRPNMLHVGYRIEQDDSSLFSYTYDGRVLTIDPVSTGAPGWRDFLDAYNEFCSEHDGKPLLNQSWGLKPHHIRKAFGDRVEKFEEYRKRFDPDERLLNSYFRVLLQGA